jgi:hypothetical protein
MLKGVIEDGTFAVPKSLWTYLPCCEYLAFKPIQITY